MKAPLFPMVSLNIQNLVNFLLTEITNILPVIGCWENSNAFAIMCHLVAISFHLVTSHNVVQSIVLDESAQN